MGNSLFEIEIMLKRTKTIITRESSRLALQALGASTSVLNNVGIIGIEVLVVGDSGKGNDAKTNAPLISLFKPVERGKPWTGKPMQRKPKT